MSDKNQQFIEQQRASDLQQARMTASRGQSQTPSPRLSGERAGVRGEKSATNISSPQTAPPDARNLDQLNQSRATSPQVMPMPEKPRVPFPWIGCFIALLNDILDILELTGIAIPATKIIDFIMFAIRGLGKMVTPGKTGWGGLLGTWFIEEIPWVGMLPTWTVYVIWNWLSEKKLAKQSYEQTVKSVKMQATSTVMAQTAQERYLEEQNMMNQNQPQTGYMAPRGQVATAQYADLSPRPAPPAQQAHKTPEKSKIS